MYQDINELEKNLKISEFPLNVIIEPGNFCNLNCTTCANNKLTRKKGRMNMLLYKKIIDEIAQESPNTRIWLDFYGEPLLQRYMIYYMIDYARKSGLTNININTNGTLMDEEMAEMLLDSGLTFLSIDCDGFSKEVYENIRLGGGCEIQLTKISNICLNEKKNAS